MRAYVREDVRDHSVGEESGAVDAGAALVAGAGRGERLVPRICNRSPGRRPQLFEKVHTLRPWAQ
jgi:hypothetical protein